MCMPLTHQSATTWLAMMTRVCFLPAPCAFFLNTVISARSLPPAFLSLSFLHTHHSRLFQSRHTSCGGVRQPLPRFAHFHSVSLSLLPEKCYHCLILVAIIPALGVTAPSYPTPFSSQIKSCAAGDRANVPLYCRWAVVCKLNCEAHSLPHHRAHIKTKGNDSPIVIYYLAPSVFDHKRTPQWWSCRLGLFPSAAPLNSFAFVVLGSSFFFSPFRQSIDHETKWWFFTSDTFPRRNFGTAGR